MGRASHENSPIYVRGAHAPRYCKNRSLFARNPKRMRRINAVLRWGGLMALAVLAAACGYFGGSQPAAAAHSRAQGEAQRADDPATKALAGMVEAVGPSGTQAPIELRFSIRDRPEVGQDDELDYAIVPQAAGLETIRIVFGAISGLKVVSHGPVLAAIKPASGVPIFGSITVRPTQAGLFTLTVAVAVENPSGDSVVWPFTIPVIAGEGPAQTAAN